MRCPVANQEHRPCLDFFKALIAGAADNRASR
jgi:hypothetical protein